MTSILKIELWMFQKMCILEFDILFVILIIIFIYFRFVHVLFTVAIKYFLSQQSQHQHLLMIWKNAKNTLGKYNFICVLFDNLNKKLIF
jgi:hypothetical protein